MLLKCKCRHLKCKELCSIMETNLNDIPVLNHCSEQLFVFRVILLLFQVSCMLEGKIGISTKRQIMTMNLLHCSVYTFLCEAHIGYVSPQTQHITSNHLSRNLCFDGGALTRSSHLHGNAGEIAIIQWSHSRLLKMVL